MRPFSLLLCLLALCTPSYPANPLSWSAPDLTTAADSIITFNEIMYHPSDDNASMEWVELYNQMSVDIDLSNWHFEGAIDFRFPTNSLLLANSYAVVALDPAALREKTGLTQVFGPFLKRLGNDGEFLQLRNNSRRIMDEMSYGDTYPWPVAADGSGGSLAKFKKHSASSPPSNWRVSLQVGGTPGRINFPDGTVVAPRDVQLLTSQSSMRWTVPSAGMPGADWPASAFDDSAWNAGTLAVGFGGGTNQSASVSPTRAYSFDGHTTDISGNGFDAHNLGADFSPIVPPSIGSGQSFRFNGASDEVRIFDDSNPTAYTIAAWVRINDLRPSSLIVRTDGNGPNTSWSHQLRLNSSGQFEHYIFDGRQVSVAASDSIQTGVWYHVVITAQNNEVMKIYVNGLSSGGSPAINSLWENGNQWRLGTSSGHTPNYFNGHLDEMGIWSEVLKESDIQALAAGARPSSVNGYKAFISTDVQTSLLGKNSSFYLRSSFNIPAGSAYDRLNLSVRYDDAIIAYLNGRVVARLNAPADAPWNAAALSDRQISDAIRPSVIDLSPFLSELRSGKNILAIHVLNSSHNDPEMLFHAELTGREITLSAQDPGLLFNEITSSRANPIFLELINSSKLSVNLAGYAILSSAGGRFIFGNQSLAAGDLTTLSTNDLGFRLTQGDKLFLLSNNNLVLDGVRVSDRLIGRSTATSSSSTDQWLFPKVPSPGAVNQFSFRDEIVINEIMYHAPPRYQPGRNHNPLEDDEQWIELFNRSNIPIDLGGWRIQGGVNFVFPPETFLDPGTYLVIARNAFLLSLKHPGITIAGQFSGRLSHRGDHLLLIDSFGNPADELTYYDGDPWPAYADGGGSSLERRNPDADSTVPASWGPSDESSRSSWRRYTYRASAITPLFSPPTSFFREFRLGILDEGEALIDNVSVIELPGTAGARELLQNTNFTAGTSKWRLLGNHSYSSVLPDPSNPANNVLHLVATGPTSYLDNRLETSLKVGATFVPVTAGREYEISFDAKWIAGSPQIHTELYYNKVVATKILDVPILNGTPGRRNSIYSDNLGPSFKNLTHRPAVPPANQPVTISVYAHDEAGISSMRIRYRINETAWREVSMNSLGDRVWEGTIPGQAAESTIHYYLQATDLLGATSLFPSGGTNSRALIKVTTPTAPTLRQRFRIIMTPADATKLHNFVNLMSDHLMACTVIHEENEIFYDAKVRLHGSMFSRQSAAETGFTVKFPADHLFRGSRSSVVVRRASRVESFLKHLLNKVGGIPANYDDIVQLISHRSDNRGPARLNLALYDDTFVDSQFENNNDGTIFKFEGIRIYQQTQDGTPEGLKLPQPVDFAWAYDLTDLGNDPEQYRWSIMIGNQRARDDYSGIIRMGKALKQTGALLQAAAGEAIDIEEWARLFGIQNLFGISDIYGVENPHNVAFYVRPDDGRVLALQNDWGFAFSQPSGGSIYGRQNVFKVFALPIYRRVYQGQLHSLINHIGNNAYITRWAQHYSTVSGDNVQGASSYIASRINSIRNQLAPRIPFEISSNSGATLTVTTPSVLLQGRGWIDVRDLYQEGRSNKLSITWLDDKRWEARIPLELGTNQVHLLAYDYDGALVGQDSIEVVTSASGFPQRDNLRITEIMYHPADLSPAEIAAGFTNKNQFEYVELINIGTTNLSLLGVEFDLGLRFAFSSSTITNLDPGKILLVVKDLRAFQFRHGSNLPIAGEFEGQLDNAGELIRLIDSFNNPIQIFTYEDGGNWPSSPDGQGYSLEVLDYGGNYDDPLNWRESLILNGSPGSIRLSIPQIASITVENDQIQLVFATEGSARYTVYWSSDLAGGVWIPLASRVGRGEPSLEQVIDLPPASDSQRFYRLGVE